MTSSSPAGDRRSFINAADALFALLFVLAVATELTGGFRTQVLGLRISVTSTWRILAWAALVAIVRHAVRPTPSLRQRIWDPEADSAERRLLERGPDAEPPAARRWRAVLVVAAFTAIAVVMLYPQVVQPLSVPDHGDPLFSIWRLSWIAHQLPRDPLHLFDANIFSPHPRTLAYSDAMLLPGLAGAPLIWLGVHQVLVYNLLFFSAIVGSGATTAWLVRALTGRWDAAAISGLLFAFCAYRFAHYSHLELQITLWMPLALLWLHRTIVTGRVRDGLLMGAAVALQGLSSLYYGMFFVTLVFCLTGVLCAVRHADARRVAGPLAAGALLALTLLVPATIPFWEARGEVGVRSEGEVLYFSAAPADYRVPHVRSIYHRDGEIIGLPGERQLFPGVVPLALAAIGLWPPLTAIRLAYTAGLALAFDASLGFNGGIYRYLYTYIVPFQGFRSPARFAVLVALTLSVLAGYGAARLAGRLTRPALRHGVMAGVALAALVEARPMLALEPVWTEPPSIYEALPRDRAAVLAEFPFPRSTATAGFEHRFMYFSTFHWHRLVNGASGFVPQRYKTLIVTARLFPADESLRLLRQLGAEYIMIHGPLLEPAEYERIVAALATRQDLELRAVDAWESGEMRLYRLGTKN